LPVNGLTAPIRSPSGFHIIKALEDRWQDPEKTGESYDEVHARHILLQIPAQSDAATEAKIRQRAASIANDMTNASDESFAARAREDSQGPSASKGGDLGWFKKGMMIPAFEETAFRLNAGETSGVVETGFGLHIIRVVAKRHVDPNSFEARKEQIQQILSGIEMQEQHPRWLAGLKATAKIEKFSCDELNIEKVAATPTEPKTATPVQQLTPEAIVENWRLAWVGKDLEAYFANYSAHFHVGKSHASLAEWKTYRSEMIQDKRFIRVAINDLKVIPVDESHVRCEFTQVYESDVYSSSDRKALILEKDGNSWKIVRELTFL